MEKGLPTKMIELVYVDMNIINIMKDADVIYIYIHF